MWISKYICMYICIFCLVISLNACVVWRCFCFKLAIYAEVFALLDECEATRREIKVHGLFYSYLSATQSFHDEFISKTNTFKRRRTEEHNIWVESNQENSCVKVSSLRANFVLKKKNFFFGRNSTEMTKLVFMMNFSYLVYIFLYNIYFFNFRINYLEL